MKNQIDRELNSIEFHFNMESLSKKKQQKHLRRQASLILLCLLLTGTTVYAGTSIYNHFIRINKETLPALDSMKIVETNDLQEDQYNAEDMLYRKQYFSYAELQAELGVQLLSSVFAEDNSSMIITRETDNEHWTQLKIIAYILGDVTGLKKLEENGSNQYTWIPGSLFRSPINMTIDIISSEEQLAIGWEKDYLGPYTFAENFQSSQGYEVNLLYSGTSDSRMYQAIFVTDGIRYTLKGNVDVELMKEIINSFHF